MMMSELLRLRESARRAGAQGQLSAGGEVRDALAKMAMVEPEHGEAQAAAFAQAQEQVQTLQAELGLLVDADRQKQERLAKLQTQLNTARGGTSGRLGSARGTPRFNFGDDVIMLGGVGGGMGGGGMGGGGGGGGGMCLGPVPGGGPGGPGGAAGGLAPPPIMAPPPIGGAGGAPPPPPPIAGGAPPPPPMIGGPPPPPPPPGGGPKPPGAPPGPMVAKAKPNKPQVHPTAKMKALHWKRIILEPPPKDGDKDEKAKEKQFWELVKEPKFDVSQFEEMFSQKTTAKETEAKKESKNSMGVSKVAALGGATI